MVYRRFRPRIPFAVPTVPIYRPNVASSAWLETSRSPIFYPAAGLPTVKGARRLFRHSLLLRPSSLGKRVDLLWRRSGYNIATESHALRL